MQWKKIDFDYLKALYLRDEIANFKTITGEIFEAKIKGVNSSGQLLLAHQNNEVLCYDFKEIVDTVKKCINFYSPNLIVTYDLKTQIK